MTLTHAPLAAALDHDTAVDLQVRELDRHLELMRSLDTADWDRTVPACPDWTIRELYLHLLGTGEAGASMAENLRQMQAASAHRKRRGGQLDEALAAVQIARREALTPAEIIDRWERVAPRVIRARRKLPAVVRDHAKLKIDGPVHEKWSLGYLTGTICLRDLWLHRVDVHEALGRPFATDAAHDGPIVHDVVAEWARRHGRPFDLLLEGPAGGSWAYDPNSPRAERIVLDAVEFCRLVGGRGTPTGLLTTVVPF